jgi:ADP-ribosyl-[dinitrogen reductase] hydrolase
MVNFESGGLMSNNLMNGIMGLCVADALGVPVEFVDRETLRNNPVVGMRSYGTHNQPAGTWSDDTSMTLCLVDSLSKGLDYKDIMTNFLAWLEKRAYTPHGEVFDVGISTKKALKRFSDGTIPLECGGTTEHDNGNGSLMRILPILFYLQSIYGTEFKGIDEAFSIIHNVSALTHAHKRSQLACGIYISIAALLMGGMDLKIAVELGIYEAMKYYRKHAEFADELRYFKRLESKSFAKLPEAKIKSSGYVVDTLEAAIWCLLKTNSYKDCVLKAVNLGEDTDTVAAVTGGLAGLRYGYESIPKEWISTIAKRDYIESLCNQLYAYFSRTGVNNLCSYIPYFETATRENLCQWGGGKKLGEKEFTMAYPIYDHTLEEFIQAVYKTNLISYDYLDITNERDLHNTEQMIEAIDSANFELVKAILTGYVRQERFCDGLWASAVEDKAFLKILLRLQQLNTSI